MLSTLEDRLVVGEESALRDLFVQYSPVVSAVASDLAGEDTDDLTVRVFVNAWAGRAWFDPSKGSVQAWLLGGTREELAALAIDEADSNRDEAIDRRIVAAAVERLPPLRREVVERGLLGEDEEPVIADGLDMPEAAVASHLRQGIEQLGRELGDSLPKGADSAARLQEVLDGGWVALSIGEAKAELWDQIAATDEDTASNGDAVVAARLEDGDPEDDDLQDDDTDAVEEPVAQIRASPPMSEAGGPPSPAVIGLAIVAIIVGIGLLAALF